MKNKVMAYRGGGYGGCFWEWNFCWWDKQSHWHDIYSSGRLGARTEKQALRHKAEDTNVYIYDLRYPKHVREFQEKHNPGHVKGVTQKVNRLHPDKPMFWVCDVCGCEFHDVEDMYLEGWHGCGGIMSQPEQKICYECYSLGLCPSCEEYVGEGELQAGGCCSYCTDTILEESGAQEMIMALVEDKYRAKTMVKQYCEVRPAYADKARSWLDTALAQLSEAIDTITREAIQEKVG
jgi:hypothetical protein